MKTVKSSQHFNAYYLDNSLLIQFIISEFFKTYSQSQQVMQLAIPLDSQDLLSKDIFPQISQAILNMLGTEHDNSRPWTSQSGMGSLYKLKKHCELLSSNSLNQNKANAKLQKSIHRAWVCSLNCHELIRVLRSEAEHFRSNLKSTHLQPFGRMLFSLNTSLTIASKFLLKAAHQYSLNKNVSLFLNRHQDQLIKLYGPEALELLTPKNIKESLNRIDLQSKLKNLALIS